MVLLLSISERVGRLTWLSRLLSLLLNDLVELVEFLGIHEDAGNLNEGISVTDHKVTE